MTETTATQALQQIPHLQAAAAWLAASREEALEPELPLIDAHHHFSEHWGGYLPEDLLADMVGHQFRATVYVQCGWQYATEGPQALRPVGETQAVLAATHDVNARQHQTQIAAAIVGFADLCLGHAVDDVLAAQISAGQGRLTGIRNSGAYHAEFRHGVLPRPIPRLYADAAFREGYACLERHGLSFDAWVYHTQLADVLELATAFPRIPLILDHVGGLLGVASYRGRQAAALQEWLPWIKHLAQCPNVHVKLGGMGTAVFGFDFTQQPMPPSSQQLAAAWRPLVEPVLEAFGAERCMFESNFPLDRSSAGYGVVWNALKRLASGASKAHKVMLFHDNAARLYRITLAAQ